MDISNTILTEAVSPPEVLPYVKGIESAPDEQKKKIAEDFESLLLGRLLEEMGKTAEEWGDEHEQVFGQVKGIFTLYLSQYIGSNSGFGLAKQIYESLNQMEQKGDSRSDAVDKEI